MNDRGHSALCAPRRRFAFSGSRFSGTAFSGIVLAGAILAGCDAGIHVKGGASAPAVPPIQSGVFKDSNVAGLDFVSGSERGVTGANGEYSCETAEPVRFSIGSVVLGETECTTLAHPPALTPSGSFTSPVAVNIARLLLMLDDDQDPENGILIPESLRDVAPSWSQIDFAAADFPAELAQIISDIFVIEGRLVDAPPTAAEAFAHMEPVLACAYSGVFTGSLPALRLGNVGNFAITIFRDSLSGEDRFLFQAFRPGPYLLFIHLGGSLEFATLPVLDTGDRDPLPGISGRFRTPDRITGIWTNPSQAGTIEANMLNSGGPFNATRLGGSAGQYRFVGNVEGSGVFGALELDLDGDSVSGEVFGITSGRVLAVTGTRSLVDDSIELSLEGAASPATARLLRDGNGRPSIMTGGWPDSGASFTAYGCRLN